MRPLLVIGLLLGVCAPARAAVRSVHDGDNLQAVLDAAQAGDEIRLDAGAKFTGNFILPVHGGTDFITIRTALPDGTPPIDGQRVSPETAAGFARIASPNTGAALRTAPGARYWRVMLVEFPGNPGGYGDIIQLGDGSSAQNQLAQVPVSLVLDRVYVHGDPLVGQKRGIAVNAADVTIRNSWISDIKAYGIDSQAIGGWNGPGPLLIENNYLEASTENFMLGGSDPAIPGLVTSDVTFRYNYLTRPLAWRDPIIPAPAGVAAAAGAGGSLPAGVYAYVVVACRGIGQGVKGTSATSAQATVTLADGGTASLSWSPVPGATEYRVYGRTAGALTQYWTVSSTAFADSGVAGTPGAPPAQGSVWQVKNVFELKNARNVVAEYNVFENNWQAAQSGYAIVLTPRNQDGSCTWCIVENVTFQHNIVRNTAAGFNISGYDSPSVSRQASGITIRDNLVYHVSQQFGGNGWAVLVGAQPLNLVFDHNTFDHDGTTLVYLYGLDASARALSGFQFTNNAGRNNDYGINGDGASPGTLTLQMYLPGSTVTANWISGAAASRYPHGNRFDEPFASFFASLQDGDYRLTGALATPGADGRPIGADAGSLRQMLDRVTSNAASPQAPHNFRVITVGR